MEVFTTDLPYPVKNLSEKTKQLWADLEHEVALKHKFSKDLVNYTDSAIAEILGPKLMWLFKVVDMKELLVFCVEEQELGNNSVPIRKVLEKGAYVIHSYTTPGYIGTNISQDHPHEICSLFS
jgi:hypothetical protein